MAFIVLGTLLIFLIVAIAAGLIEVEEDLTE